MKAPDCFKRLMRMDFHIRHKSTGNPKSFRELLEVSETTFFRNLLDLKNMGAEIVYDKDIESYIYEKPFKFGF